MTRRIHTMPADEAVLRAGAAPEVGDLHDVRALAAEMARVMAQHGGIGLAAPQVGDDRPVVLISPACFTPSGPDAEPEVMIAPKVVWASAQRELGVEGCLSLPGRFGVVSRPAWCVVEWRSLEWAHCTTEMHGLAARCVQHEIDHLAGALICDVWEREILPT